MYKPKLEKDIRCPLEYGLEVFGGKWKSRIICVLAEKQVLRYSTLRREMGNITDAVLSAALKELIGDNIVCRWSGTFHKEENDNTLAQCRRCDYNC